jgi:hypothetical protein
MNRKVIRPARIHKTKSGRWYIIKYGKKHFFSSSKELKTIFTKLMKDHRKKRIKKRIKRKTKLIKKRRIKRKTKRTDKKQIKKQIKLMLIHLPGQMQ